MLFNGANNAASYNRCVSHFLHGADLLRVGKPKTDSEWKSSHFSNAFDKRPGAFRDLATRARHAGARNQIDEAGGSTCYAVKPLIGGSGSAKENGIQVPFPHRFDVERSLFRREIDCQHAVCSGLACIMSEVFEAVLQQRIVIAEQDERRMDPLPPFRQHSQDLAERRSAG